ncbi:MAG: nitrogen fixation protein NifM [Oceanospirillaceae bacterium]|nr:nitrogen fixation protein NifM [Oceanospirillaceae bacterium]|tara:strand:- start:986 stop:1933 length:948 start_codon:yes stop_codon:yes gene_type:complete
MNTSPDHSSREHPSAAQEYRFLRIASERFGAAPTALDASQREEVERIAKHEEALEVRVLATPEALQVSVPDSQLKLAVDQVRERYESEQDFEQALIGLGMDEIELAQQLERSLRVESVLELVASKAVRVNETDASMFYYLHPEKFQRPERRGVRHILLTVNDQLEGNDEQTAERRISEIASRIEKHPNRFADQALKHSECPTAMNGGWLGDVPRGVLYPELEEQLFQMKPGESSLPVRTELGWHVLMCDHILPSGTAPLDDVVEGLIERLQEQQDRRIQRQWLAECMQSSAASSSTATSSMTSAKPGSSKQETQP